MKNLNALFLLILFAVVASCSTGQKSAEGQEQTDAQEWQGMDEFHMIMAESFHPYKDSGNLEPLKLNAVEMAHLAEKWAEAPLPNKVNKEEIREKLALLESESETLASVVDSGDEQKITEKLEKLHDLFHELQDAWYRD